MADKKHEFEVGQVWLKTTGVWFTTIKVTHVTASYAVFDDGSKWVSPTTPTPRPKRSSLLLSRPSLVLASSEKGREMLMTSRVSELTHKLSSSKYTTDQKLELIRTFFDDEGVPNEG